MGQRLGQLCEFRDKPGGHRRVAVYGPNLAHHFRPDDAPALATPARCGAEFTTTETGADVADLRLALERAWRLMLVSRSDRALAILEAVERRIDDRSLPSATRYRAAAKVLRLALVAFQDDSFAILAIKIAQLFVEPMDHRPLTVMKSTGEGVPQPVRFAGEAITTRERDVLSMIGRGCSNKHIARKLEISPETVKSHIKNIFSKLDVSTRTEAVSRALSLRLL
jgi:ATP/maltotriose-dependent transcriptional regulator MalT